MSFNCFGSFYYAVSWRWFEIDLSSFNLLSCRRNHFRQSDILLLPSFLDLLTEKVSHVPLKWFLGFLNACLVVMFLKFVLNLQFPHMLSLTHLNKGSEIGLLLTSCSVLMSYETICWPVERSSWCLTSLDMYLVVICFSSVARRSSSLIFLTLWRSSFETPIYPWKRLSGKAFSLKKGFKVIIDTYSYKRCLGLISGRFYSLTVS